MARMLAALSAALVVMVGCGRGSSGGPEPAPSASAATAAPAPPVDPVKQSLILMDQLPVTEAFSFQRPVMTDAVNEDSSGTQVFAMWAARRMRWPDVGVAADETSPALVRKDPDEARGKRICASGQIIQIAVQKPPSGGKLAVGILSSDAGYLYRFFAAGSSGALVENSYAHFCGLVTGLFDYSNSVGGTGHAISLVGMFDLPENRPR
jgi:hypothetical protein